MVEDPDVRRELIDAFGDHAYRPDGSLDRAYLASRVFGDAEALAEINGIVHPRVYAAFENLRARSRAAGVNRSSP